MKSFIFTQRNWLVAFFMLILCMAVTAYYFFSGDMFYEDSYFANMCAPDQRSVASQRLVNVASKLGYTSDNFWVEYDDSGMDTGCRRVFVFATTDSRSQFENRVNSSQLLQQKIAPNPNDPHHSEKVRVGNAVIRKHGLLPGYRIDGTNIECEEWGMKIVDRTASAYYCPTKDTSWYMEKSKFDVTSDIVIVETIYP
ncbi:MAG: hypothetical protein HC853_07250 [Anaerolineae bacterium]|nr:hypothetical protein [Anaerolineae bacterium]